MLNCAITSYHVFHPSVKMIPLCLFKESLGKLIVKYLYFGFIFLQMNNLKKLPKWITKIKMHQALWKGFQYVSFIEIKCYLKFGWNWLGIFKVHEWWWIVYAIPLIVTWQSAVVIGLKLFDFLVFLVFLKLWHIIWKIGIYYLRKIYCENQSNLLNPVKHKKLVCLAIVSVSEKTVF